MIHRLWMCLVLILSVIGIASAQDRRVSWSTTVVPNDIRAGEHGYILVQGWITPTFHIYAIDNSENIIRTSFKTNSAALKITGPALESEFVTKPDPVNNANINMHEKSAAFIVPIQMATTAKGKVTVPLTITSQACTDSICEMPVDDLLNVAVTVAEGAARPEHSKPPTQRPEKPSEFGVRQSNEPEGAVTWYARLENPDVRPGETTRILLTAVIGTGFHIYSADNPDDVFKTVGELKDSAGITKLGPMIEPNALPKMDAVLNKQVKSFSGTATFALPIRIAADAKGVVTANVSVTSQACDNSICEMPLSGEFALPILLGEGEVRDDRKEAGTETPVQASVANGGDGTATPTAAAPGQDDPLGVARTNIWRYILIAFIAGVAALATPCVWPMIPITVSYFSKNQGKGGKPNVAGALAFSLGIIGTFTVLGIATTLIFGASNIQIFASNAWLNLGLGILFVVLALNLFGVFEIALPSGLANKAQSSNNTWLTPVPMGFAFTITSFTCTVPFVGTLLASATVGNIWTPTLGMVAFSSAFALPFFLLALFPGYLAKLPKSGGWLANTKIYLGFIELAAALKFFSNADLIQGWFILTREVYLAVWAAIFFVAAIWLFGWMRLGKEESSTKIGVFRRGFALANVAIAFIWLGALNGRPLGWMEAFPPPKDYSLIAGNRANEADWRPAYEAAVAEAQAANKPLLIDFTGYNCVNCRYMEGTVFPDPAVHALIETTIPVKLYTDNGTPENNKNAELRKQMTNSVANPAYAVVTPDGRVIATKLGSTNGPEPFRQWLSDALNEANSSLASNP